MTMAQELTVSALKHTILEHIMFVIASGQMLTMASMLIEAETGQKANTSKNKYQHKMELVLLTSGGTMDLHGNQRLTERQEKILVAILLVLSWQKEGILAETLAKQVEMLFGVSVNR
jgi:hypothetical protein